MDTSGRHVRSRTSSTSSLRSPSTHGSGQQPATPAHTPNTATLNRSSSSGLSIGQHQAIGPDQLAAGLSRIRAEQGSRNSSIPPTPAPTPNPLLQVSHHMVPEQLVAGIKQLRADEGYIDSTSFPATPAPSPFSPSPAQFSVFSPDQVAEGIQRLREESGVTGTSGASSGQPPTPSTTPGPGLAAAAFVHQQLGIIPEHLAESIQHLRGADEGVDSISNPATPVPTPISPSLSHQSHRTHQVLPEQLAAGIHRLKVEEGMSSGGSSGFPSTPAPTPFSHHPGGVRPEDLAAGISRLSVIEEGDLPPTNNSNTTNNNNKNQKKIMEEKPSLSQYFEEEEAAVPAAPSVTPAASASSFFDQLGTDEKTAVMHSCRESRVDLSTLEKKQPESEAKIDVVIQNHDDARSLHRRQSIETHQRQRQNSESRTSVSSSEEQPKVCTFFADDETKEMVLEEEKEEEDPFDTIAIETTKRPSTLPSSRQSAANVTVTPATPTTATSTATSSYSTPVAPTPINEAMGYSTYVTTSTPVIPAQFNTGGKPITSPFPTPDPGPTEREQEVRQELPESHDDDDLPPELLTQRDAWILKHETRSVLEKRGANASYSPDRSLLTMPGVHRREELVDPVGHLVSHYRGEAEAAKRNVLNADSVSQDQQGLIKLVEAGCYRAGVNLTTRLLHMCHQGSGQAGCLSSHSPSSLQIWHTRLALLVKLKQFSMAEVEAEPFESLDKPDMFYQYYPDTYPDRRGSMAPFSFRVLLAELPQYLGKPHDALDKLYALLATVKQIIANLENGQYEDGSGGKPSQDEIKDSLALWKQRQLRVMYSLANCAVQQKDFELATSTLNALCDMEAEENRANIKSLQGRVFLQLGDIVTAMQYFEAASNLRNGQDLQCDGLLDSASLSIAGNNYVEALTYLQEANEKNPKNPTIVNNLSVCLLYLGRLKEALTVLESNLTENPAQFLLETPVLNLATLYELESSYAGQKKQALLDLMSRYSGDGVNTSCLKF